MNRVRTAGYLAGAALFLAASTLTAADRPVPPHAVPFEMEVVPVNEVSPRLVTAWETGGTTYLPLGSLALALDAEHSWRPELGRMILSVQNHEIAVFEGSDAALIDGSRLHHLSGPVQWWDGDLAIPLDLVVDDEGKAHPWIEAPLTFSRSRHSLEARVGRRAVEEADIAQDRSGWKLTFGSALPLRFDLISAERTGFVVRIPNLTYDPLLHPLPPRHEWFREIKVEPRDGGIEIRFVPSPRAVGYRVSRPQENSVEVFLGVDERDLRMGRLRTFRRGGGDWVSSLFTIGLDPGHGGRDGGAELNGGSEAYLTHVFCERLAEKLREQGFEAPILRERADGLRPEDRAERARRLRADVLLSIHIHPRKGGPAAFVAATQEASSVPPPGLAGLGFRASGVDQARYRSMSQVLARFLVEGAARGLEASPQGVEARPLPELQAASMPAILLEISGGDVSSKLSYEVLDNIAKGVAEGFRLYQIAQEEDR